MWARVVPRVYGASTLLFHRRLERRSDALCSGYILGQIHRLFHELEHPVASSIDQVPKGQPLVMCLFESTLIQADVEVIAYYCQ